MSHVDDGTLHAYLDGELSPPETRRDRLRDASGVRSGTFRSASHRSTRNVTERVSFGWAN